MHSIKELFSKNFILLFQGQFFSVFATSTYTLVLILWIKGQTESATLVGLISMIAMIPVALFGPIAGSIADNFSKEKILVICDIINLITLLIVSICILLFSQYVKYIIFLLIVSSLISGINESFLRTTIRSCVPDIVNHNNAQPANSLLQSSILIAKMIGQMIGGILFISLETPVLILIIGLIFLVSAFSESFINIPKKITRPKKCLYNVLMSLKTDTKEGLLYIRNTPGLRAVFAVFAVINFFMGPLLVLLPFYAQDDLGYGSDWYGLLIGCMTAGMIFGSVLSGFKRSIQIEKRKTIIYALATLSLTMAWLGISTNALLSLFILFILGASIGLTNVTATTVVQLNTPEYIRGRIFGVMTSVTMFFLPVSMGLSGLIAETTGISASTLFVASAFGILPMPLLLTLSKGFKHLLEINRYNTNNVN